ncbi:hypothetical protein wTkk_000727 [Wolbachia endosymbiont of Trichogramma kaykai]
MELIVQEASIHLLKCCSNFESNPYEVGGVIPVLDTGI